MYFRLLFVITGFLFQAVTAQPLFFKHLSVNEGLSQAVNNCIYRDSKGFIWISSFDGLNRFDGVSCQVFRTGQAGCEGLKGTLFLNILEDKSGNIWIGSNEGLNLYNWRENRFYNFTITSRKDEHFYSPLYIDQEQQVWVQSGHELFRFNTKNNAFIKVDAPFTSGGLLVKAIALPAAKDRISLYAIPGARNMLYHAVWNGSTIQWDSTLLTTISSPVTSLYPQQHNKVWLGTRQGLYHWSPGVLTPVTGTENHHITALQYDDNNRLWIGTQQNGLLALETSTNRLLQQQQYSLFDNHSLAGNQVLFICADHMKNLWVSVWGKGIDYTNLARFRFHHFIRREQANEYHTDNFIKSIVQVENDSWCGTQAGGIVIIDSGQQIKGTVQKGLPASSEHMLALPNEVWLATTDGMFAVSTPGHRVQKFSATQQFNYITQINNNRVLLSSNAGLYISDITSKHIVPVKGAGKEVFLASYKTRSGALLIGRPYKGFMICRMEGDSLMIEKNISIEASVKCYFEKDDSTIWIGTTQGLIHFNSKKRQVTKIYSTNNGLSNQYIYGIVPEGDFLWLSTNAGINRFHTINHQVKTYSVNDGLQSNEFNTYAYGKTKTGIIQFGGINGLTAFDPSSITQHEHPPQLQLSDVQLNDHEHLKNINPAAISRLSFKYDENTISFQFTVLHYDEPLRNSIQYKLKGYDKAWISAGNKNYIRYAKLPAGNFTLMVKAFSASGNSSPLFLLPVSIQAPWWQSWWFRMLMAVVFIVIIVLSVKVYTHQKLIRQRQVLEKELAVEQERTRVARDLHDGLGGMLSGIKHAVAALQRNYDHGNTDPVLLSKTLSMLDESILELRRVAYSMTPPSLSQFGLDHALRDYCSSVSGAEGLNVHYQSIAVDQIQLNETKILSIFRIVQELVNNIIKHAGATEALVQLGVAGHKLSITVEDNGIGFDKIKSMNSNGLGWKNIRSRVENLPGIIDLQSTPGKGSSVYIEMKIT